jgi:TolB protein
MELPSKRLVRLTDSPNAEYAVCWSADGTRVLIRSVINGQSEILLSTLIGQPLRLTNNLVNDVPVAFSPDGNRILFFSERSAKREIYTMALNGTNILQLTNNQVLDYPVRYFPDGLRILYWSMDFNNNAEIHTVDTKGGLQSIRRITAIPWANYPVDVSRDGNLILYYSEREPGFRGSDIFTIRM